VGSSFTRSVGWFTAIVAAITLLLYLFVFDTWEVPGTDPLFVASVQPTLHPEDRILTSRHSTPHFGELARCLVPDGRGTFTVGRVFGVEGETVEVLNERVSVDGKAPASRFQCGTVSVVHPVSQSPLTLSCSVEDNGAFTYSVLLHPEYREGHTIAKVEPGKVFLVSDDRHIHYDSRDFGQVDASTCQHVVFRLWGERFTDSSRRFNILW
jgi:signal peptidase I